MKSIYKIYERITPFVPHFIRAKVRQSVALTDYDLARRAAQNPFLETEEELFSESSILLGIIADVSHYHKHYISACRERKQSYRVIDLLADNWQERIKTSGCDAFLVWPSSSSSVFKSLFDTRLHILQNEMGRLIYPTWKECWLTEDKPRLRDWLDAFDVVHPKTWVVYQKDKALKLADTLPLPIVSKTAIGASGSGVNVIYSRSEFRKLVKLAFARGLRPRSFDPRDRQRGFVYLQEYLPDVDEWRMVRIGDSYFGYRKEKGASGLHSASHKWSWLDPGEPLLNLLKKVTDLGGFTSMDVDVFVTKDGQLLVNELQTVFGCSTPVEQMKIDDVEGRYVHQNGEWYFEPGEFCRNHMCNLRIEYLLQMMRENGLPR